MSTIYNSLGYGYGNNMGVPNYNAQYMQNNGISPQMPPQAPISQGMTPKPYSPISQLQGIIFATEEEVKGYLMPLSSRIMFMDKDKQVFYIKSSDSLGISNIEYYSFNKFNPDELKKATDTTNATPNINLEDYVKRDEIKALPTVEQYNDLLEQYKAMTSELATLKKRLDENIL